MLCCCARAASEGCKNGLPAPTGGEDSPFQNFQARTSSCSDQTHGNCGDQKSNIPENIVRNENSTDMEGSEPLPPNITTVRSVITRRIREPSAEEERSLLSFSNKKQKIVFGDKQYMLAPFQNHTKTVIPGLAVVVEWTLVVKSGVQSRWEVVQEEGNIIPDRPVSITQSALNIWTIRAEFTAPIREGVYSSTFGLFQDSNRRESFEFCKLSVVNGPLSSPRGSGTLASHGNIPAEIAVPKLLNSNKVFCMSNTDIFDS